MAGYIYVDKYSQEENRRLMSSVPSDLRITSISTQSVIQRATSSTPATATITHSKNPIITTPPFALELRQNNPQDCSNLIIASVDRATVEISRTIIALNATFSQQLRQASISASNGIRSAQDSASSTIGVVVQSASVATSAAFSSVRFVNLALTSVSSTSSIEVSRLSSSLSLLEASVASLQV